MEIEAREMNIVIILREMWRDGGKMLMEMEEREGEREKEKEVKARVIMLQFTVNVFGCLRSPPVL